MGRCHGSRGFAFGGMLDWCLAGGGEIEQFLFHLFLEFGRSLSGGWGFCHILQVF